MVDEVAIQNSARLWQFVTAALFMLGGVWLQNQYAATQQLQLQVLDVQKEQLAIVKLMDERYVTNVSINRIWNDTNRRMDNIERKLDRLIEVVNADPDHAGRGAK